MSISPSPAHGASYEREHVHQVYDQIASHFSSTRYKPWPVVDNFLQSLSAGSVGLDVGCGNGKYLTVNRNVFIIASDRSGPLVEIARKNQPHSSIIADILDLPHPSSSFDFAISIAVIHHLSTTSRRVEAIRTVLGTLLPPSTLSVGGQALFFVWALEQKNSRRGWDSGDRQDVLVPWILKDNPSQQPTGGLQERTFQRYYHLYEKGELERDVLDAGGDVIRAGYDRDNWWVVATRAQDSK